MDLLFQGFFFFFNLFIYFFFMEDSKYLCFNGAKKLSQSNISSSLGELNATEIPLNMIDLFNAIFSKFCNQMYLINIWNRVQLTCLPAGSLVVHQ